MRIAYFVNTYPKPSQSFIRREIQALERRGVEIHRFALRDDRAALVDPGDIAEDDLTEHVLAKGAPRLICAALRRAALAPLQSLEALRLAMRIGRRSDRGLLHHLIYLAEAAYLAERCQALGIEHLHAHFGTNSATVAMLAATLGGARYSFTVHGPEEFDRPEALALGEKMRRAAFTVAVSAFGRSQLCRWADQVDWPRIHVVHCGIEPERFPAAQPLPAAGARLVSIGRLVEQKGQLLLVEAFAMAIARHPELHLTLVGDGELRGAIEAAIRRHRLERHIEITGWVDEVRVRTELAAAHALVMPSFAEGLPMVVMEAMASGRPVISTYIAGIPELVRPGETGWLVPAGDADALAAAIGDFAATPRAQLAAMGAAGRARALRRHDIDASAAALAALFAAEPEAAPIAAPRRAAA